MFLHLSDEPRIDRPRGAPLPLSVRDAALLAWLVIEGPTSRERLGALLWPASGQVQARNTLRQRLFQLKKALGSDVAIGSPTLALAPGLPHDLGDATELLGELTLPDAPDINAWLQGQRERLRSREHDALRAQVDALEAAGEIDAAVRVADALRRLQPLSEAAHQRVMRLHYLLGDRAQALAAFDACEQVLKHELGARPSAATLTLLAAIERAGAAPPGGAWRSLPAAVQRPPATVGRERERQALEQAWQRGQVAVVTGEAGLGKSRLLADFRAAHPGITGAAGRPGDAGVPYATLVRLLRAVGESGAADAVDARVRHQLARVLPELALEGSVFDDAPRAVLQQAVAAWLRAAPGVTGLLLDDLHFADAASLDMLQALLADGAAGPPHWALAYRGAEASSALRALEAQLADGARLAHIHIAPLDAGALAELVDQLGLGWSGAAVAGPLLQRTGGNPLFLLETLKQAWLQPSEGWPKPESVERLLDRRITRLAAAPLALARVAAVAGVDFDIGLAASVLGSTPLQLADALNELETAQVLRGLQFTHDLVFDAVLRSVPQAITLHVHAQVAAWLEVRHGEPARIAAHWLGGGQPERAPPWLGQAAQRSARMLRNVEALEFLELKAQTEADAGDRPAAFASQVEAVTLSLDVDREAARGAARCARLLQWAGSRADQCEARFWHASLAFRRVEPGSLALLQAVLAEATSLGETRLAMECRVMLTLDMARTGRFQEALAHAQDCLGWIEAHGGLMRRGELHTYLAQLHAQVGSVAQALGHHTTAIAIARELGVPHHVASVLDHLADTLSGAGRSREALPLLDEVDLILARHQAAPANTVSHHAYRAKVFLRLGHFTAALQALDDAEALFQATGTRFAAYLGLLRGQCWAELGQWARLQAVLGADSLRSGSLTPGHELHRAVLAALLDEALGRPAGPALGEAAARLPAEDLHFGAWALLHMAPRMPPHMPPAQALSQLDDLRQRMAALGFDGHVAAAHLRSAQIACASQPALAREHALTALAAAAERDFAGTAFKGELWLHCSRALLAAGDTGRAAEVLAEGQAWLRSTAAEHVPDVFRDGFLHRSPPHAALLAMVIARP